ncbi:MAG: serine/threonine-protein phosphatase [Lachnospiraceae bacterium]|nr:serine/threonine-protein phosphatase [Lachnospiraceae bacterium]
MQRFLSYQVGNVQGIGDRNRQEDSFAFANALDVFEMKNRGLFAIVADGMGGMMDGALASEIVVTGMLQAFESMDRKKNLASQLNEAIVNVNESVYERLRGHGGSTAVACIFYNQMLLYASVGDSFLFLLRDKELIRINREHTVRSSIFMETIREGGMNPERGRSDPEETALTSYMGIHGEPEIDSFAKPLILRDQDVFLLCSDGIGGILAEEDLAEILTLDPPEACQEIDKFIREGNFPEKDNYTGLVIKCVM